MADQFNVTYMVNNGDGESETIHAQVSFSHNPDTYGNGYYMNIKSREEPFGRQGYDIRYDTEFTPEDKLLYIAKFYAARYDGKDGRWKLIGLRIHEAEF